MRYGSVCSGIEAASVAWQPLGWRCQFVAEIERFPSAVLQHHYPDVPNYGDMTRYQEWPDANLDLLVGGTPCQSFSVAGLRQGLADPRGNLALVFLGVLDRYRPRWVVWENVFGVLSSNGGRDIGAFLGALGELGYGWAYRVLDAQYVRVDGLERAVPQRRRRVFVVGHLGDWRRAAAVLFERESLSGHPPPRRQAGEGIARGIEIGPGGGGFTDVNPTLDARAKDGPIRNQLAGAALVARCVTAREGQRQDWETETLVTTYAIQERAVSENPDAGPGGKGVQEDIAYTLEARQQVQAVATAHAVRRLTPRECERLQGFEDDYTLIEYRGKPAADGPRYKALGNSMAVNVMRWIGQRIALVESVPEQEAAA